MTVECISVASFIVMSIVMFCVINIYLLVLSVQLRPVHVAVTIPLQPSTDDGRPRVIPRFGNRPVPQENNE